jgi:hypothetical protein
MGGIVDRVDVIGVTKVNNVITGIMVTITPSHKFLSQIPTDELEQQRIHRRLQLIISPAFGILCAAGWQSRAIMPDSRSTTNEAPWKPSNSS